MKQNHANLTQATFLYKLNFEKDNGYQIRGHYLPASLKLIRKYLPNEANQANLKTKDFCMV